MEKFKNLIARGALFVVSHSGGKDSQAMYSYIKNHVPEDQIFVVHASLGEVEWPQTIDHIKNTIDQEVEFEVVNAVWKDGTIKRLLDYVKHRGKFPSSRARYCTSELKVSPIWKAIRKYSKENEQLLIVDCIGIRAEESKSRAEKGLIYSSPQFDDKNSKAGREVYRWYPIFFWSTDEVFNYISINGQNPHVCYSLGMSRCSCMFCIFSSKNDLKLAKKYFPKLFKKYCELEEKINHTLKICGTKLADFIGK